MIRIKAKEEVVTGEQSISFFGSFTLVSIKKEDLP